MARTVVLTGATSGIGEQLLKKLLARSEIVIAVARHASTLPETSNLKRVNCDLSRPAEVVSVFDSLAVAHPKISLLINNAAVQHPQSFASNVMSSEHLEAELNVNLLAPALITRSLAQAMRQNQGARIVNVSSGLALAPKAETGLYCASKAGLHSLSLSMRSQLQPLGISVVEIFLPLVDTPMTQGRGTGKLSADTAATLVLSAADGPRDEVYVGKTRILPVLARFSPRLLQRFMRAL